MRYTLIDDPEVPDIATSMPVSGTVTYLSGVPAAGVAVTLTNLAGEQIAAAATDETGSYTFEDVAIGQYTLTATDTDGRTAMEPVSVRRMTVFDVFLVGNPNLTVKDTASIYGRVTMDGSGVENADVVLLDEMGGTVAAVVTGTDGSYWFSDISNGTYTVKATSGTNSAVGAVTLFNEDASCDLVLVSAAASIAGTVTNETGNSVPAAEVGLFTFDGVVIATVQAGEGGAYAFANVPHGDYAVYARGEWQSDDQLVFGTGCAFVAVTGNQPYTADITLYQRLEGKTTIEGKVTAQGQDQKNATVVLTDVFGNEVASYRTKANGKYAFNHVADGVYTIVAITSTNKGSAMTVVVVKDGRVYGETDLWVAKSDKIAAHEAGIQQITPGNAKAIADEKAFYDSLPEAEKRQFDPAYVQTLDRLIAGVTGYAVDCTDDSVTVAQSGLAVSADEIRDGQDIGFTITVQQAQKVDIPETGIETEEQFTQQQIEQAAGDEKEIFSYYDIWMVKSMDENQKTINTIRKDTDTTGKLLVTLPIPEEYRGHANYSAVHMHNGQPVTLADLDDNPDTITVRLDGFSRFAFAYDDMVNQAAEDAVVEIADNQVFVTTDEAATLYIASYDSTGQTLLDVETHPVAAGAQQTFTVPDGFTNAKVFLWRTGGAMQPLHAVQTVN